MEIRYIASIILPPVLLVGIVSTGCKGTAVPPITQPQTGLTSITLKGVGLSPKSNSADDFTGFFQKAKEAGNLVMWAGDWNDFNKDNGGPAVVAELASRYGYIPVVEAQFFSQSTGKLLRPMDETTRQLYKNIAANFSRKHKPKYFGLGIEVNVLKEKSPDDFQAFTQFFSEVYDAIKEASPDTKVFTVFQLEKMKGLNGGLFGGINDPSKAEWDLLDKFPKADLFAFTTYPGLIYKDPAEIPDGYYSEIRQHTVKPVAFTEIGWHNEASPAGWESSEEEQARFIERFFNLTQNLKPSLAIWSFLYDQQTAEPFRSMGMLARDGVAKESWEAWGEANKNSKFETNN